MDHNSAEIVSDDKRQGAHPVHSVRKPSLFLSKTQNQKFRTNSRQVVFLTVPGPRNRDRSPMRRNILQSNHFPEIIAVETTGNSQKNSRLMARQFPNLASCLTYKIKSDKAPVRCPPFRVFPALIEKAGHILLPLRPALSPEALPPLQRTALSV